MARDLCFEKQANVVSCHVIGDESFFSDTEIEQVEIVFGFIDCSLLVSL